MTQSLHQSGSEKKESEREKKKEEIKSKSVRKMFVNRQITRGPRGGFMQVSSWGKADI